MFGARQCISLPGNKEQPLVQKARLHSGDRLRVGKNASVLLKLSDGTRQLLGSNTEIELVRVNRLPGTGIGDTTVKILHGETGEQGACQRYALRDSHPFGQYHSPGNCFLGKNSCFTASRFPGGSCGRGGAGTGRPGQANAFDRVWYPGEKRRSAGASGKTAACAPDCRSTSGDTALAPGTAMEPGGRSEGVSDTGWRAGGKQRISA